MKYEQFFWLHVKKSGGEMTRSLLQPYYVLVDRTKKPKCFIQSAPEEYNDILNNYRVVLGDFQFRRCLFAKTFLYPGRWDDMCSFAFSREPVDRCVSMFYYLYWNNSGHFFKKMLRWLKMCVNAKKLDSSTSYAFDVFLDQVHKARSNESIYEPLGQHFATHTAPMWDDITDFEGNILLKKVIRLESLIEGINLIFDECGIDKKIARPDQKINKNTKREKFTPASDQINKIEKIFYHDFEIYQNAWHC